LQCGEFDQRVIIEEPQRATLRSLLGDLYRTRHRWAVQGPREKLAQ
jgi:hypothetical protein